MTQEQLAKILNKYDAWLAKEPGGDQADLSHKDLSGLDFRRKNLSGVDFSYSNMSNTNMCDALLVNSVLIGTNLSRARLCRTNLSGAELTFANMSCADLTDANLSNANLYYATLTNTELGGTVFTGAGLASSALDPRLGKLSRTFSRECPATKREGRVVYRTLFSQFKSSTTYEPGHTYVAPVLSWSVETPCHPGIYAGSLRWMTEKYPQTQLMKCYVRVGDWTITAKGCIRCSRLRVLSEYLPGEENHVE